MNQWWWWRRLPSHDEQKRMNIKSTKQPNYFYKTDHFHPRLTTNKPFDNRTIYFFLDQTNIHIKPNKQTKKPKWFIFFFSVLMLILFIFFLFEVWTLTGISFHLKRKCGKSRAFHKNLYAISSYLLRSC